MWTKKVFLFGDVSEYLSNFAIIVAGCPNCFV